MNGFKYLAPLFFLAVSTGTVAQAKSVASASDYNAVLELSSRYAWGIDKIDRAMLETVFTPDANAHYVIVNDSPIKLDQKLSGFDAIFNWLNKSLGHRKGYEGFPWHFVSNQIVTIDGDKADLRFYMHNRPGAAGGVYYMKAVRTAKGWRINNLHLEEQIWHSEAYGVPSK